MNTIQTRATNVQIQNFVKYFAEGMSHKEIGNHLGVSKSTVSRWRKRLGLSRPNISRKIADDILLHVAAESDIPKLAIEYNVNKSSIYERLRKLGIPLNAKAAHRKAADKRRIHDLDTKHFEPIDEIGCYYLGLFYADGSVFHDGGEYALGISLKWSDNEILYRLASDLGLDESIVQKMERQPRVLNGRHLIGGWYAYIRIHNYHLLDILRRYGLNPGVDYKECLPVLPHMGHFLRGYLDGDGTITMQRSNYKYSYLSLQYAIHTKNFADELNSYIHGLGVNTCLTQACIPYIKITGSNAERLAAIIWDNPIRRLERKYKRYTRYLQTHTCF